MRTFLSLVGIVLALVGAAAAVLSSVGCSSSLCTPGMSIACACPGGGTSAQVCQSNGTYAACQCDVQVNVDFSGGGSLDFAVTGDLAGVTSGAKRVFVTSASYGSILKTAGGGTSGLDGADKLCNNVATGANLRGTWKAWLSDDTTNAIDRIADVGPWLLTDGKKAFNNKAGLTGTPLVRIEVDENKQPVSGSVWTGTHTGGNKGNTCSGWNGTAGTFDSATTGDTLDPTRWTDSGSAASCSSMAHLYCIEQ
jgi:hypothetical protein